MKKVVGTLAKAESTGFELSVGALPRSLKGRMGVRAMNKFLQSMLQESDRGLVIGIISVLDDLMAERLKLVFKYGTPDARKSANGAFHSFGHRINGMHALGLINDETAKDLHFLRERRNKVSHQWAAFSLTPEVEETFVNPLFRNRLEMTNRDGTPMFLHARMKLMWVALILIITLHSTKKRAPRRGIARA